MLEAVCMCIIEFSTIGMILWLIYDSIKRYLRKKQIQRLLIQNRKHVSLLELSDEEIIRYFTREQEYVYRDKLDKKLKKNFLHLLYFCYRDKYSNLLYKLLEERGIDWCQSLPYLAYFDKTNTEQAFLECNLKDLEEIIGEVDRERQRVKADAERG